MSYGLLLLGLLVASVGVALLVSVLTLSVGRTRQAVGGAQATDD
jgi:hypothetical protein